MPFDLDAWIDDLLASRKYRQLNLPRETIRDLLEQELAHHNSTRAALKAVREKLHQIVAPYLGDPDYVAASLKLDAAFRSGDPLIIKNVCMEIMQQHASTRERIPHLAEFYKAIFAVTGKPQIIIDLACGLNPLSFPWMDLSTDTQYHAWDLHQPRVTLINTYFRLQGLPELAFQGDILVNPPKIQTDVTFFFKEAHRFDQRRRGCNRNFWQAIHTHWLIVTLPSRNLTGHHSLIDQHRRLVMEAIQNFPWQMKELEIGGELIFCL